MPLFQDKIIAQLWDDSCKESNGGSKLNSQVQYLLAPLDPAVNSSDQMSVTARGCLLTSSHPQCCLSPPPIKGGIKSNYSMPPMDCARLAAVTPVMTLTKTRKVALMSWPYNRQSLVRCCVCSDCFKDTVHCLTENYFSNYLLFLAPRTGLNTGILRAQFSRVPPLIWKWNVHACKALLLILAQHFTHLKIFTNGI